MLQLKIGWEVQDGLGTKLTAAFLIVLSTCIGLLGFYGLSKPVLNGCIMTYMYPTYIPISSTNGGPSTKYGLYLYHEGWKKIDVSEHLKHLSGIPVLFIPGNGGSYKQVRSLAAESYRAYQGGPVEPTYYQKSMHWLEEGLDMGQAGFQLPNHYGNRLDWFSVDLKGEHSAMDCQIIQDHTDYVVHAIHRVLDLYKESHDSQVTDGDGSLPKSVILVAHSMGGFVARAVVVHSQLRRSAVETIVTLSTPHQLPPVALQPSLGYYFLDVNEKWRKRYEARSSPNGQAQAASLSHIVVISISGSFNDHQMRSSMESLDDIVPASNGFMVSSTGVRNVWLSVEHQTILWCNQLVVQVAHTLLSLIDCATGQPFPDTRKRLMIFSWMLQSEVPQSFRWMEQSRLPRSLDHTPVKNVKGALVEGSQLNTSSSCPNNIQWNDAGFEKDLHIKKNIMTILAMDGKRRWLDIHKLGSNGSNHFILATNLAPCFGVRFHLWPQMGNSTSSMVSSKMAVEVTSKLIQIPSGPAPRQMEPGTQTEQAPPSGILWLSPEDMHGFRFLTVSVAPPLMISGRPPPAVSMAVGQFFNPKDGEIGLAVQSQLLSFYSQKEILLAEGHPLALKLSFAISLGLLPISFSLVTTGCGIKRHGLRAEEVEDMESNRICTFRCFPPIALAWDPTVGMHTFPNFYNGTIIIDSSPALWRSLRHSEGTTILLLVDPHCSYSMKLSVSATAAASRFLLSHGSQMVGFFLATLFFALMRQRRMQDLDLPMPSVVAAVLSNLRIPSHLLLLGIMPILISLFIFILNSHYFPAFTSFSFISLICYFIANGSVLLLVLVSQWFFYAAAAVHIFIKTRWLRSDGKSFFLFLPRLPSLFSSSLEVARFRRIHRLVVAAVISTILGCFFHPALGLFTLCLSHAVCCYNTLSRMPLPSDHENLRNENAPGFTFEEHCSSSSASSESFAGMQLEMFHQQHGILILHFLLALMFTPSLIALLQRKGAAQRFPCILDSVICVGVVLHGLFDSIPEPNSLFFNRVIHVYRVRLDLMYLFAGYYSYFSGLGLVPYRVFYAIAGIGFLSLALRILHPTPTPTPTKCSLGPPPYGRRKHSHRH